MKKRLFIVSIVYLVLIITFSFCWKNLPLNNSKKGDDIISCIGLIAIITLIYSVISKLIVGKIFLVTPMVIMPFISFTISIIILLIINAVFGGLADYLNLQLYFYLHGIVAIACLWLIASYSIKGNALPPL